MTVLIVTHSRDREPISSVMGAIAAQGGEGSRSASRPISRGPSGQLTGATLNKTWDGVKELLNISGPLFKR